MYYTMRLVSVSVMFVGTNARKTQMTRVFNQRIV